MEPLSIVTTWLALQGAVITVLRKAERAVSRTIVEGTELQPAINEFFDLKMILASMQDSEPQVDFELAVTESLQHQLLRHVKEFNEILDILLKSPSKFRKALPLQQLSRAQRLSSELKSTMALLRATIRNRIA